MFRITAVEDMPSKEYLNVVYDVAEGPLAGCFSKMGPEEAWKHRFTRSYSEKAEGMFKGFLEDLEASNLRFGWKDWMARSNEQEFVGLLVGVCVQKRMYTNGKGEDKESLEVRYTLPADKVRSGDHRELPEPRDKRKNPAQPAAAAVDDSDVPF